MSNFFVGMLVMLFLIALGPHRITGFFEDRANMPKWLLPSGVLALLVSVANLLVALGSAIMDALALSRTTVETWVWWMLVLGVLLVTPFILMRWVLPKARIIK